MLLAMSGCGEPNSPNVADDASTSGCADSLQSAGETDVDCGGPECAGCANGKRCQADHDCLSMRCKGGTCAAPETCSDNERNGAETDVDCGGGTCTGCGLGKRCLKDGDCKDLVCQAGTCQPAPTCMDKMANGDETDVDCGGPKCPACERGKMCLVDRDCRFRHCTGGVCVGLTLGFAAPISYALNGVSIRSMAAGDLNGDGRPDVAVGLTGGVEVLLNQGNGKLGIAKSYPTGAGLRDCYLSLADVDGDNRIDVVAAMDPSVFVYRNLGGGAFDAPMTFPGVMSEVGIATGDLDGDGLPDAVLVGVVNAPIAVLLNQRGGKLGSPTLYNGNGFSGLAVADVDQDGKLDVAVSQGSGFMTLHNNGDGTLQKALRVMGSMTRQLIAADLDGDGKVDIATCSASMAQPGDPNYFSQLGLYFNEGGGAWTAEFVDTHDVGLCSLVAADFDGDKILDVAVAGAPGVEVSINQGRRKFAVVQNFRAVSPYAVVAADIDGDGRTDLIIGNDAKPRSVDVLVNTTF